MSSTAVSSSSSSSSSGGTLEEHSCFHDASPGRTIRCSPQCRVKSKLARLSGLRSLSIVRSQDWWGRPLGRRQSTGRRSVDARSERQWSSEAAAQAICPNSLRRCCCISEETGDCMVGLWPYTDTLVTCAVYGTRRIRRKHHWSKASTRCLDASVTLHMCPSHRSTGRI